MVLTSHPASGEGWLGLLRGRDRRVQSPDRGAGRSRTGSRFRSSSMRSKRHAGAVAPSREPRFTPTAARNAPPGCLGIVCGKRTCSARWAASPRRSTTRSSNRSGRRCNENSSTEPLGGLWEIREVAKTYSNPLVSYGASFSEAAIVWQTAAGTFQVKWDTIHRIYHRDRVTIVALENSRAIVVLPDELLTANAESRLKRIATTTNR